MTSGVNLQGPNLFDFPVRSAGFAVKATGPPYRKNDGYPGFSFKMANIFVRKVLVNDSYLYL